MIKNSKKLREDAQIEVGKAVMAAAKPVPARNGRSCVSIDPSEIITAYLRQAYELIRAGEIRTARTFLREDAVGFFTNMPHMTLAGEPGQGDAETANFFKRLADEPNLEKLFSEAVENHSNEALEKIFDKANE